MLLLMVSEHVTLSVVQDVPQSTPGAMAHWSRAPSGTTKGTVSVVQDVPQSTPGAMAHWSLAPSGTTKGTGFKLQTP